MRIPFDRSRPGAWISAGLHGSLLLAAVVGFSTNRLPQPDEGIPVEVLTDTQFSEMTRGERQAAKPLPDAKPQADRVADRRVERDPGEAKLDAPAPPKRPAEAKVADEEAEAAPPPPRRVAEAKPDPVTPPPPAAPPARPDTAKADAQAAAAARAAQESKVAEARKVEAEKLAEKQEAEAIERARIQAARAAEQQRLAAKARAEEKAEAEAEAKAEARSKAAAAAKAKADAEAKADLDAKMKQLAEADAKARADAAAKAKAEAESKAKAVALTRAKADAEAKARRQAEAADTFSPGAISKLLSSKDASQSTGATGRDVQKTASLGTAAGNAQRLNPSQREQLIGLLSEQLHRCWQVPVAAQTADKPPVPVIRVKLNQDGTLATEPVVTNSGSGLFQTVAESATRATRRCAPLRIPAQFQPYYNDWRDLLVNFDPRAVG